MPQGTAPPERGGDSGAQDLSPRTGGRGEGSLARRRGWHELSRALTHKKSANRKITYVISARAPAQKTTPTPRPRRRRCFMRRAAANGSRPRQRSRPPWEILLARIGERPTAMPNTRPRTRARHSAHTGPRGGMRRALHVGLVSAPCARRPEAIVFYNVFVLLNLGPRSEPLSQPPAHTCAPARGTCQCARGAVGAFVREAPYNHV